MSIIQVGDLRFRPYLSEATIQERILAMGAAIQADFAGQQPVFLVMLKGAFLFAADLVRAIGLPGEVGFVRLSSYTGTQTTRRISEILSPDPREIAGKPVIIIEDIVDSGHTLHYFLPRLQEYGPASVSVAALLHKPTAQEVEVPVDYVGFTIPPYFVVGYGLDYNGLGRQLRDIYQLDE